MTIIHPMIAPALLVKDIKVVSSVLIKTKKLFKDVNGWQEGSGAFTYAQDAKQESY